MITYSQASDAMVPIYYRSNSNNNNITRRLLELEQKCSIYEQEKAIQQQEVCDLFSYSKQLIAYLTLRHIVFLTISVVSVSIL